MRKRVWGVFALVWLLVTPTADAFWTGLGYQYLRLLDNAAPIHHELHVELDMSRLEARFRTDFTVEAKQTADEVYVLLGGDVSLDGVTTTSGAPVAYRRHLNLGALPFAIYRVSLPERLRAGERATLRFSYHISPQTAQHQFPFFSSHYFFAGISLFWYPQLPAEGFFTARIQVDAPESLAVIAEGVPVAGSNQRVWETPAPVPGLNLLVGRLVASEIERPDYGVRAWSAFGIPGHAEELARHTLAALEYFSARLEPLPVRWHHVIELPLSLGATVSYYTGLVVDGYLSDLGIEGEVLRAYLAAHEAAHKWLGFTAGFRLMGTTWLSEGLVDYLAFLAVEHMYGSETFRQVFASRAVEPLAQAGRLRALSRIDLIDQDRDVAYQKGAMVFRALHRRLGDDGFFAALRAFIAEYRHDHATSDDFIAVLERQTGHDLRRFVQDWVRGTHELDYALSGVRVVPNAGGEQVTLRVQSVGRLTEPGAVEVEIEYDTGTDGGGAGHRKVAVEPGGPQVTVVVPGIVRRVVLDPDFWTPDRHRADNVWERNGVEGL